MSPHDEFIFNSHYHHCSRFVNSIINSWHPTSTENQTRKRTQQQRMVMATITTDGLRNKQTIPAHSHWKRFAKMKMAFAQTCGSFEKRLKTEGARARRWGGSSECGLCLLIGLSACVSVYVTVCIAPVLVGHCRWRWWWERSGSLHWKHRRCCSHSHSVCFSWRPLNWCEIFFPSFPFRFVSMLRFDRPIDQHFIIG